MKSILHANANVRFVIPVALESMLNTAAGLIFSYLIGGISGSSLTTIAQGNQVINLICAAATMLVTGSGILCARLLGAGEQREASRVVEQTVLMTAAAALAVTAVCFGCAEPLMRLLMPGADADVLGEGVAFFRVLILSLPFALMNNALTSALRASGDGRSPLVISLTLCLMQLAFAWLFLRAIPLDVVGAGLSYLISRALGTAIAFFTLMRSHRYIVTLRGMLRAHMPTFHRILSVGVPTSIESIFVQTGYLIAGSMVIGLGTFEAASYNVANTLYSFASLPQTICATVAPPIIGQLIGAGKLGRARSTGWRIWAIGMSISLALSLALWTFGGRLTPIYSSDPAVQAHAADALFAVFVMCIPAISLNTLDPQLRVGGDVRYVMYSTIFAVWAIRLPLTYLLCYVWSMGAGGVFWANTISLCFRMVMNMRRFIQGKYLHMKV